MPLEYIELSRLTISPANMRAKRRDRDIVDLIPSVRARGVLVPLLVRPSGEPEVYEIVAGRRRYYAAKVVADETGTAMALPCAIMEQGDDVGALEASTIENVERLDPDEVTRWETFARLVKEGRAVEDIAATFGLEEKLVRRVLALGNLLPRIRTLHRTEQIDAATVRHLTLATIAQQKEWLALFDSPDQYAPKGRILKEWLFGGAAIPTDVALFDLAEYTAPIVGDLFDEKRYFSDAALFWDLQTRAIEEKRQAYLADGWNAVAVIEPGTHFASWDYEKRGRAKGGKVYIVAHESGAVEIHEGYLPRKEADRDRKKEQSAPAAPRPELSAPLRRYIDLHRHAAARARLLDLPWLALRLLLAHAIAGSPLWNVKVEDQRADKDETAASLKASPHQARFEEERRATLARLGLDPEATTLVAGGHPPADLLFRALLGLWDEDVLSIVPVVMGETLWAGSLAVDALGDVLQLDMAALWQADDAFFTLLRDRRALLALVEEVAGHEAARGNIDSPVKVLKTIIRDCLAGQNARAKVESWVPRWLRFPASSYLVSDAPSEETVPVEVEDAQAA